MMITDRQFLGLLDNGISIAQLNSYIQRKPELYDGEHTEVEDALKRVLGEQWEEFVSNSRTNDVVFSY